MRKIGEEIRFEQTSNYISRELAALEKNPLEDKILTLQPKFKDLDRSISKIEETLMTDRRYNKSDVKIKVDEYKEERKMLWKKFEEIKLQFEKKQLFQPGGMQKGNLANYRLLDELDDHNKNIERQFVETRGIVKDTLQEVGNQRKKIEDVGEGWQDADVNLTVIDQFMRMISNRNLLTKIILLLLAIFLGLADIAILVMKIS